MQGSKSLEAVLHGSVSSQSRFEPKSAVRAPHMLSCSPCSLLNPTQELGSFCHRVFVPLAHWHPASTASHT